MTKVWKVHKNGSPRSIFSPWKRCFMQLLAIGSYGDFKVHHLLCLNMFNCRSGMESGWTKLEQEMQHNQKGFGGEVILKQKCKSDKQERMI